MLSELEMLHGIFDLQNEVNELTSGNQWLLSSNNYYRAAWMEAAELLDYYNWEWWKAKEVNIDQAKMEVIDILHFLASEEIRSPLPDSVPSVLDLYHKADPGVEGIAEEIEDFIYEILLQDSKSDIWFCFFCIVKTMNMDLKEIYELFVKKATLNRFRQNQGYRQGTYVKTWANGEEDNVFLSNLTVPDFLLTSAEVSKYIYDKLELEYNTNVLQLN